MNANRGYEGAPASAGNPLEPAPPATAELRVPDEGVERCPECETGTVVQVGPLCGETGHVPYACSEHCGWSS